MRIVVTGSEGFIGSRLVPYLENIGHSVDRVDLKLGTDLHSIQWWGVDAIIHLAAQTSVWNMKHYDIERDNLRFFMEVADMSNATGAKLIYASSSCADPQNITSMYGLSKFFNEKYARLHCRYATGLRFHNVYGPTPRTDTLLGILEEKTKSGQPVLLFNSGQNKRHFTFLGDILETITGALDYDTGKVYNCLCGQEMTTLEFTEEFKKYHPELEVIVSDKKREMDKSNQRVEDDFPSILCKTSVPEGMSLIYGST